MARQLQRSGGIRVNGAVAGGVVPLFRVEDYHMVFRGGADNRAVGRRQLKRHGIGINLDEVGGVTRGVRGCCRLGGQHEPGITEGIA